MQKKYRTESLDLSILQDKRAVEFIKQQPTRSAIYFPRKGAEIAKELQDLVNTSKKPQQLVGFVPYLALKALREPATVRAIFETGFKADTAFDNEARFCLEGFPDLISPKDIGCSHVWQGKHDIQKQVERGVRSFVVDKKETMNWLKEAGEKFQTDQIQVTLRIATASEDQGRNGMPSQHIIEMARYARNKCGLTVDGLAFHLGTAYGLPYATPGKELEFFQKYAQAIRDAAHLCNELRRRGLLIENPFINTEGAFRHSAGPKEFLIKDIIDSQVEAFEEFTGPVVWKVEPGRIFAPCAVGKVEVKSVGEFPGADGLPGVSLGLSVYGGGHDRQWEPGVFLRLSDVLQGDIFTPLTHRRQFQRYHVYGDSCAGSDEFGKRGGHPFVMMPKKLKPGEVLLALTFATYHTCLSPQAFQVLEDRFQKPEIGFNGGEWPVDIACPY